MQTVYEKIVEKANHDFSVLKQFLKVSALEKFINMSKPYDNEIIRNAVVKAWKIHSFEGKAYPKIEGEKKILKNSIAT